MSKNDDLVRRHLCGYPEFGTYEGQVVLVAPDFLKEKWPTGIGIDVCLALEIQNLWRAGIKTTGHCCGHGRSFPYIGVYPEHIEQMKAMGYEVQPNTCRPGDEDSFVPKTMLSDAIKPGAAQVSVTDAMVSAALNQLGFGSADSVRMRAALEAAFATPPAPAPDAGEEVEKWKNAFAAQSRKLQAVLHIPGVKEALSEMGHSPTPQPPAVEAEGVEPVAWFIDKGEEGFRVTTIPRVAEIWTDQRAKVEPLIRATTLKAKTDEIERLRRERDAARQALEHDRSKAIAACNEFSDAFKRRSWLLESRGSYEWDDDRYRDEFRQAYDEMVEPINRLRDIGRDWSNCPTNHEEIMRSRQNWQSRAEAAEASNKALRERPPRVSGISFEVATNLLESFGGDDTDMTLEFIEDGHSGTGFYAWCTEYPEDGSTFVGKASEFSPLSARALLSETGGE